MTAIKIMNCLGEFLFKKIKEISFSDIISLRDTMAENENWPLQLCQLLFFFFSIWFCCVSERKRPHAPTSLDLQKINSVDDVETIAYKVNEILLKAG